MKNPWKSITRFTLLFLIAMLLLIMWWQVGSVVYSNWLLHIQRDSLTRRYGDSLIESVEKYRIAPVIESWVNMDMSDHSVACLPILSPSENYHDEIQNGKSFAVLLSLDYSSAQVSLYTDSKAELLIVERWKEVAYQANRLELGSRKAAWVKYTLYLENNIWEIRQVDTCPLRDKGCVAKLTGVRYILNSVDW